MLFDEMWYTYSRRQHWLSNMWSVIKIIMWKTRSMIERSTVQRNYFEGYKFCGFRCFPAKCKNYFRENEWTPIVTWLNYACNTWDLFSVKSKFWQICKIYSPQNICAVRYWVAKNTFTLKYCTKVRWLIRW